MNVKQDLKQYYLLALGKLSLYFLYIVDKNTVFHFHILIQQADYDGFAVKTNL